MAIASLAQGQREEMLHGRAAWVLDNGLIRVSVLRGGGHIAEVRLVSRDPKAAINPMRVPHYQTIDPHEYNPAKHDSVYGDGSHRFLSSGYMGHLLCFPYYGPPSSEEEIRAGLGNHGEAPVSEWRMTSFESGEKAITLQYGANLPRTQYRVERRLTMPRGKRWVKVDEWIENLAGYDRPFQWMQHATFGPPFVEPGKTTFDVSATKGLAGGAPGAPGSLAGGSEVVWPRGTDIEGKPADLRRFQPRANTGIYYALLMDPARQHQFFALFHPDYRVLVGYVYPAAGNPWIADWQENRRNTFAPWNGQVVARGIEFGNSPFAEGLRKAVERGSLFGVPAYEWIQARQRRHTGFTIFVEEIEAGFPGVKDVEMRNGDPVIVRR
ncbi:MAG: hypothetical protein FJW39_01315 [Acidobacteria bacterium]|nr:hypothetical protein [Acidobacteriota bacterium]